MHVCKCVFVFICVLLCERVFKYLYMYVCVCVFAFACVSLCYLCLFMCMFAFVGVAVYSSMRLHPPHGHAALRPEPATWL